MSNMIMLEELDSVEGHIERLSEVMIQVVQDGASIGFLHTLNYEAAVTYWKDVLNSDVILWVAKINDEIVGTVQLTLCSKENGLHRAEINKLMTHPNFRRKGIASIMDP